MRLLRKGKEKPRVIVNVGPVRRRGAASGERDGHCSGVQEVVSINAPTVWSGAGALKRRLGELDRACWTERAGPSVL
ncbi:hypothetical protein EYF80_049579 [Liparis tanakae]|uniref:Uncharacterized protein n=1 Tax=Liparis tanakae TaxID=230148 RepID=A0A4Z2FGD6_9TELE|nr:hypothetical protein EYF80_049579 [Liparis tanakae]